MIHIPILISLVVASGLLLHTEAVLGILCTIMIVCFTAIEIVDVWGSGRCMFLHYGIIKFIKLLFLLPDFTIKCIDFSIHAIHPVVVYISSYVTVVGIVQWAELSKVQKIWYSFIREALMITIGIHWTLILLFFNTLLIGRFHVHHFISIILMLLEVLIVRWPIPLLGFIIAILASWHLLVLITELYLLFGSHWSTMTILFSVLWVVVDHLHTSIRKFSWPKFCPLCRTWRESWIPIIHTRPGRHAHALTESSSSALIVHLLLVAVMSTWWSRWCSILQIILLSSLIRIVIRFKSIVCRWILIALSWSSMWWIPVGVVHNKVVVLWNILFQPEMLRQEANQLVTWTIVS